LQYTVPREGLVAPSAVGCFAETNGLYHAWPYFREFIQTECARLGIALVLPPLQIREVVQQGRPPTLKDGGARKHVRAVEVRKHRPTGRPGGRPAKTEPGSTRAKGKAARVDKKTVRQIDEAVAFADAFPTIRRGEAPRACMSRGE